MTPASNRGKKRFKVGDQVRVVDPEWTARYKRGKVIHIWSDGNDGLPYFVVFRNGQEWNCSDKGLEPA